MAKTPNKSDPADYQPSRYMPNGNAAIVDHGGNKIEFTQGNDPDHPVFSKAVLTCNTVLGKVNFPFVKPVITDYRVSIVWDNAKAQKVIESVYPKDGPHISTITPMINIPEHLKFGTGFGLIPQPAMSQVTMIDLDKTKDLAGLNVMPKGDVTLAQVCRSEFKALGLTFQPAIASEPLKPWTVSVTSSAPAKSK